MKGPKSGKSRKAAKEQEEYAPAKKQPTIRPGERAESVKNEKLSENAAFKRVESEYTSDSERKIHRLKDNEAFEEKSEPSFTEKIRFTFQKICDTLKKVKEMKALFGKVKPMLVRLLKEIFPKKIYGYVNFGLDDPAATGMILAVISALSLPVPRDLKITPFFDEKKLECDVSAKGRIFIIILLINVIKIIKLPEVRKLLKGAMPAGKGRKKHKKR